MYISISEIESSDPNVAWEPKSARSSFAWVGGEGFGFDAGLAPFAQLIDDGIQVAPQGVDNRLFHAVGGALDCFPCRPPIRGENITVEQTAFA